MLGYTNGQQFEHSCHLMMREVLSALIIVEPLVPDQDLIGNLQGVMISIKLGLSSVNSLCGLVI